MRLSPSALATWVIKRKSSLEFSIHPMKATGTLLIGELAKQAGVKSDTVRFYEKQGLLSKPTRTAAGYRVYDEAALKQLRFIKQAQSLGFSLQEIQRILTLRGEGRTTCKCVLAIAEATLSETERKLKELQNFRDGLKRHVQEWGSQTKSGGKMVADFCALIESTAGPLHSAASSPRPTMIEGVRHLPPKGKATRKITAV